MMKRLLALACLFAAAVQASAQEATYALPFTSFTIEVDVAQEIHFAGPYSEFAYELLNIDVPATDVKKTYVKEIRIIPHVEADPWSPRFTAPAGNSTMLAMSAQGLIAFSDIPESLSMEWRFTPSRTANYGTNGITGSTKEEKHIVYKTVASETGEIRYPVEHTVTVAKTREDKAESAAEMILSVRKDRHNIATGNTDASYSGESMAAALEELTKIEKEYLLLFTGYDTVSEYHGTFEVMPSATARTHRYTAFYLTEDGKLVREAKGKAKPYELEFTPVAIPSVQSDPAPVDPKKKPEKVGTIHYRIPAVCRVRLLEDGAPILEPRVPVYQLGRENEMPINQ